MKSTLHLIAGLASNPTDNEVNSCLVRLTPGYAAWLAERKREFDRLRAAELSLYQLEYSFPPVDFGVSGYDLDGVNAECSWKLCPDTQQFSESEKHIACKMISITASGVFWTCLDKYETDKTEIQTPELAWKDLNDLRAGRHPLKEAVIL
mgnify:CR=1 FL=1